MTDSLLLVSPHLDDAVMSVGATMAACVEAGMRVVVCTVFASRPDEPLSPVAEAFHRDCGLDADAIMLRRREDSEALAVLGAEPMHLDFADAVYRTVDGTPLCAHDRAMFDTDLPAEPDLERAILDAIQSVVKSVAPRLVWTCVAVGGHVDHHMTREVVHRADLSEAEVSVWEDLPYAVWQEFAPPPIPPPSQVPEVRRRHLIRKLLAVEKYRSQLPMLWPDGRWRRALLDHAAARTQRGRPEAVWSRASASEGTGNDR